MQAHNHLKNLKLISRVLSFVNGVKVANLNKTKFIKKIFRMLMDGKNYLLLLENRFHIITHALSYGVYNKTINCLIMVEQKNLFATWIISLLTIDESVFRVSLRMRAVFNLTTFLTTFSLQLNSMYS